MKLEDALKFAYNCGLGTVGEAYNNISIHAMSLFKYEDIQDEIEELFREIELKGINFLEPIDIYLPQETMDKLDAELNEAMDKAYAKGGNILQDNLPVFGENVGC